MTMYDAPSDRDYSEFLNPSEPESEDPDSLMCSDCPPVGYPTDKTRCSECPRITLADQPTAQKIALYAEAGCTLDEMRAAVNWREHLREEECLF